jgi:hypothetical protein
LTKLGYTTANGAFYYYKTEEGSNYETTIIDLHAYTVKERIPIKWILYVICIVFSHVGAARLVTPRIIRTYVIVTDGARTGGVIEGTH